MRTQRHAKQLRAEPLEDRHLLSGIGFAGHDIDVSEFVGVNSITSGDIDGDGDVDILLSAMNGVSWLPNVDAVGNFGKPRIIQPDLSFANNLSTGDIDGDGDLDVVASVPGAIGWFENTDGRGRFRGLRNIAETNLGIAKLSLVDIDGDGDSDILSVLRNEQSLVDVVWYENREGSFEVEKSVANNARGVDPGDMEGDGDIDFVVWLPDNKGVRWIENTGSTENEWPSKQIPISQSERTVSPDRFRWRRRLRPDRRRWRDCLV